MLFIKKIIFYILKIISWVFMMVSVFRREVNTPGPKDTDFSLPREFLCSKVEDRGKIYKFSIGLKYDELPPFALKRRGVIGRWCYQLLNNSGMKTKESPYFEIAPMNDFIIKNFLENKPLYYKLIELMHAKNKSLFKLKWLFSVKGSLWVESEFTFFRFQSHLDDDMKKISGTLSDVLEELKKLPATHSECLQPLNLIKVNGFVRGLFVCAFIEFIWMLIEDKIIYKSEMISYFDLISDAFMVTIVLALIGLSTLLIMLRENRTRLFALKYNALKFLSSVFISLCMILNGVNSHADTSTKKLVDGTVVSKHVSHSRKSGTSYHIDIELNHSNQSLSYYTKSIIDYDRVQKGSKVYVYVHEGALGYKWWEGEFYE